jgi:hypothetical protein
VAAVLQRLDRDPPGTMTSGAMTPGTTIQPAFAPPAPPAAAPPAEAAAAPPAEAAAEPPAMAAPEPEKPPKPRTAETKQAGAKKPEAGKKDEAQAAEAKARHKCIGEAKPKWYTNEEGRRKYHCVLPG